MAALLGPIRDLVAPDSRRCTVSYVLRFDCITVPANLAEWCIYLVGACCQIAAITMVQLGESGIGTTVTWRPNHWLRPDTVVGRIATIIVLFILAPIAAVILVASIPPNGC